MEKMFVVMKTGFEYNDEHYFKLDSGDPETVFKSKEAAEKSCFESNLKFIKTTANIADYFSEGVHYSLLSGERTEELCFCYFGMSAELLEDNLYGNSFNKLLKIEPTDEQWVDIMNMFNINFYEVVEVQKGD